MKNRISKQNVSETAQKSCNIFFEKNTLVHLVEADGYMRNNERKLRTYCRSYRRARENESAMPFFAVRGLR